MTTKTFPIYVAILVILILGITFWGLSARKNAPPINTAKIFSQSINAEATIRMKELVMVGDINRTQDGACTIQIKEPKHLKGMTFAYDGSDVSVSYKGIKVKLDENSKLVNSAVNVIVQALDKASGESGVDVKIDGGKLIVSGDCESGKFDITLDKKTGTILNINLDQLDFNCELK